MRIELGLFALACALGAMLVLSEPVAAQDEAATDGSSDEVARGLFQAGRASYDAGKYEDALKYFQQAYDLSQRPGLLYNIGQAADRLHQDSKTIEAFRRYLEQVPDAENRAEVEGRLRTLERLVEMAAAEARQSQQASATAAASQPAAGAETTASAATTGGDGPGLAPWIVIGGSGALLVTGVVLTIVGTGQIANVEDAPRGTKWPTVSGDASSGPTIATLGVVLGMAGVVGATLGTVWLLSSDSQEQVALSVGPTGVLLSGRL